MKNSKGKKQKIKERKNLSIINCGDKVVIKDRSRVASSVLWSIILAFLSSLIFILKDARNEAIFWVPFLFVAFSTAYMLANAIFGKIVLDALEMSITVYIPFKIEYKFSDVNYVDIRSSKPKDGIVTHKVSAYIGKGKGSVDVVTTSISQADEVASLIRGMLDSGAMEYPEGNEEPFGYEEEKKQGFAFPKRKKKPDEAADEADGVDFTPIEKKREAAEPEARDKRDGVSTEAADNEKTEKADENE